MSPEASTNKAEEAKPRQQKMVTDSAGDMAARASKRPPEQVEAGAPCHACPLLALRGMRSNLAFIVYKAYAADSGSPSQPAERSNAGKVIPLGNCSVWRREREMCETSAAGAVCMKSCSASPCCKPPWTAMLFAREQASEAQAGGGRRPMPAGTAGAPRRRQPPEQTGRRGMLFPA